MGSINPRFLKLLGLNKAFYYFEIKVESLPRNDLGKLIAPSIYPISQRDFSFEIDNLITDAKINLPFPRELKNRDINKDIPYECSQIFSSKNSILVASHIYTLFLRYIKRKGCRLNQGLLHETKYLFVYLCSNIEKLFTLE